MWNTKGKFDLWLTRISPSKTQNSSTLSFWEANSILEDKTRIDRRCFWTNKLIFSVLSIRPNSWISKEKPLKSNHETAIKTLFAIR
jgi:hypothetical protein